MDSGLLGFVGRKEMTLGHMMNISKLSDGSRVNNRQQTRPATNTWLTRQWDGCFGRKSENKAVKVSAIGKRLDLRKKNFFLMDKRVLCPIINSQPTQGTRIVRSRFCADFPTGAFIIYALPYSMYVLGGRAPDYHIVQNHVHQ